MKLKSRLTGIALLLGFSTGFAMDGLELQKECESTDSGFNSGLCYGFISGVINTSELFWKDPASKSCPSITYRQLRKVVEKHLADNPSVLHFPAALIVAAAYRGTFCPADSGVDT